GTTGVPQQRDFTVFNVGGADVTDLGLAMPLDTGFSFPGGFPGTPANGCGPVLAKSATAGCSLSVMFTPPASSTATFNGTLALGYAGGLTATRALTATATNRALINLGDNQG